MALNKLALIQRRAVTLIVSGMCTSPMDMLDIHANLLPFHLLVSKVWFQAALCLATLPITHLLHNPVKQAANQYQFIKKHHMPLHEMMHTFKLKLDLMEKISAVQQGPKWKPKVRLHIADSKEQVKEEEEGDKLRVKVSTHRWEQQRCCTKMEQLGVGGE